MYRFVHECLRDPYAFEAILNFYRTGKVFLPSNINEDLVKEEFIYFQASTTQFNS